MAAIAATATIRVTPAMTIAAASGPGACTRYVTLVPEDAGARPDEGEESGAGGRPVAVDAPSDTGVPLPDGVSSDEGSLACAGLGAPIQFPTSAGLACSSALAARGHRFALCSCDSLDVPPGAPIYTDSFDSRTNGAAVGRSAAIGVGGILSSSAEIWAGGALYVGSLLTTVAHVETDGSLRVGGAVVAIDSDIHVAGDAYVESSISGVVTIDGLLHQRPGASMDPMLLPESSIRREEVPVPAPCDCSSGFVDLGAALAATAAQNDNAIAKLGVDDLALLTDATAFEVTCGSYLLSSIKAEKTLLFAVHGVALVAVTGDVVVRGGLIVVLDPGAELDLLIGGRLVSTGGNPLGSAASPARFRIWMAGRGPVTFEDAPTVGAFIHAPDAPVMAPGGLQIFGGLQARSVTLGGQLNVYYDEAVVSSGGSCGERAAPFVP